MNDDDMRVTKRNGRMEVISFDKILQRVKKIGQEHNIVINYPSLVMKIIDQLYDSIKTSEIDELTAQQCISLSSTNLNYGILASKIIISNHHKTTKDSFYKAMRELNQSKNIQGERQSLLSTKTWKVIEENKAFLNDLIDNKRDYLIDYFGFKTLEKSYLMKNNGKCVERPQYMWLRVAIGIHENNLDLVKETYDLLSQKYFIHATPTLFNSGTPRPQLSSCFLLAMEDDSIEGIFNTLKECAEISKWAGGIGLHVHNIRANGSEIKGTNGTSNGLVPMLRVFNNAARYVDQGGGKRPGSFSIYLEPWHLDLEAFLEMKKNHGDEEYKGRDLFYALWIPDLFMKRVETNAKWMLCCPNECRGLSDAYGDDFDRLYLEYESKVDTLKNAKMVNARDIWLKILDSQMETGVPYILYKDACNKKSNQKNLGTIKSSNLCTEIVEYSDKNETAVCNLGSIALNMFVEPDGTYNYEKLGEITKVLTNNLNKVIDINYYPNKKTENSNLSHRPIGIGVQGLADTFMLMNISFDSPEAEQVNKNIFETIYYYALLKSNEISKERYEKIINDEIKLTKRETIQYETLRKKNNKSFGAYSSFNGSPASNGILQFDLWDVKPSDRYNWNELKESIMTYGIRNSLLVAPMPTASTSQILGNNECFEPFTNNIYTRRTTAGEFPIVNKYLVNDLQKLDMWNNDIKQSIIENEGSVQHLDISPELKNKYKTVWEISNKRLINMARDRGAFICQSQSLNLWVEDPKYKTLTSMHFYSWKAGLKTGMYYLRRKPKHKAQQFTIDPKAECEMCSS